MEGVGQGVVILFQPLAREPLGVTSATQQDRGQEGCV